MDDTREPPEREFFIDNLRVRIHLIIEMVLVDQPAPWEFEFPLGGPKSSRRTQTRETV